ncbi:MAG TPA: Rid family hydrolase [Burkholderiaceae bacterium]|nr:Rid family hydrolase [Burkholderiaceae bacterium]
MKVRPVVQQAARLSVERILASEWPLRQAGALGAIAYGRGPAANDAPAARVLARALPPSGPCIDVWHGAGPLSFGQCGIVQWAHDGQWLHGTLALDEGAEGRGLSELAYQAYKDVFATLQSTGCTQLLRLWNYLPHINADGGGLERYRQFNVGRQQAFLEANRPAFEGAPAACAIGTREGPFCVHFLAGRKAPLPIENPRQVSAYNYPRAYGPRAPTFSRAALAHAGEGRVALLISGTASIVGHESVHLGDVRAQTRETLTNLRAVIDAAHERCRAPFALDAMALTVYVRDGRDAHAIREEIEAAIGAHSSAAREAVYLEADICRSDLLVEIEAHAIAEGEIA